MLQLVLGVAASGRTSRLLEGIKARAAKGQASIWLVPEQFSSTSESIVYELLGDAGSGFVEVVSFRTLAERIFRFGGGPLAPALTDAGRVVYLRRALDAVAAEMKTYARHRRSAAFCAACADAINELKTAGASPAQLRDIGRAEKLPKLEELALVFEAYEGLLAGTAMDPQDRLHRAAARAGGGYFAGKACFVDNFDGFTAPEYALLDAMLEQCDVWVSLCCDGLQETDGGLGVFSPVRKTAARLLRHAAKTGVKAAAPISLQPYTQGPLAALNLLLCLREKPEELWQNTPAIRLTNPSDEWAEAKLAAAEMRRLAATGVPYSQMAVVCRELDKYDAPIRRAFRLYSIPYYTDATGTVEYTAPVAFLRAALGLVRQGLTSAALLALIKTGLCGYSEQAVAALENYVFTWSPKAADWRAPFTKNPDGLLANMTRQAASQLALAETLRADIVPRAERFIAAAKGRSAVSLSKQLYLFMASFNAAGHAAEIAAQLAQKGELELADMAHRAWDAAMGLLDEMAALLGGERISPTEYDELLLLLVRATEFGQAPQTLESAVFTAADRMRLAAPDYVFVLGLCEGEFPKSIGYSGLLTHADRDLLVNGGIQMPGSFENRTLLEDMVFYRSLTSARKTLYLSWPVRHGGAARSMSAALEPARRYFAPAPLAESLEEYASTPAAAFDVLGGIYRANSPEAAALYAALEGEPQLAMLQSVEHDGNFTVPDAQVLHQLAGREMSLSPTRAERYYECRFSYFMERVLGVRPRRKAQLSPVESGTFVHYLLEQVLAEAGEGFAQLTDPALQALAEKHAQSFIDEFLPDNTKRGQALLDQIKQATTKLLCYLRDSAAQSGFSIDAVELAIGDGPGDIPPLELTTSGGEQVRVTGKVDRVDVLKQGDKTYLCIVDYKTGGKKFSLDDVYCGLNMQMMIYMHTLLKNGAGRYPGGTPAGVLYLTGDPAPASGSRQGHEGRVYELDGMLLDDPAILRALDSSGSGLFLPFRHRDGKPLRAGKKLADAETLGRVGTHVEKLLLEMAEGVYGGDFAARPYVKGERRPCSYCGYRAACRHEDGRNEAQVAAPPNAFGPPEEVSHE